MHYVSAWIRRHKTRSADEQCEGRPIDVFPQFPRNLDADKKAVFGLDAALKIGLRR